MLGEVGGGWQVAMTTLLHERGTLGFALSAALDANVRRLVELGAGARVGASRATRSRASGSSSRRSATRTTARSRRSSRPASPGPEGSVAKLHWSEAEPAADEARARAARRRGGLADDGYWNHQQLRSRGNTIEAGTSEILRNIIAERVLGLPRGAR